MPAASAIPVLSKVIKLVVSLSAVVCVNVAAQVRPPSLELTADRVPLATLKSVLLKPVTASLKVIVTSDVSPAARAVSATTMVALGSAVSMV